MQKQKLTVDPFSVASPRCASGFRRNVADDFSTTLRTASTSALAHREVSRSRPVTSTTRRGASWTMHGSRSPRTLPPGRRLLAARLAWIHARPRPANHEVSLPLRDNVHPPRSCRVSPRAGKAEATTAEREGDTRVARVRC